MWIHHGIKLAPGDRLEGHLGSQKAQHRLNVLYQGCMGRHRLLSTSLRRGEFSGHGRGPYGDPGLEMAHECPLVSFLRPPGARMAER